MRILLADDNPEVRSALRLLAEELGHSVSEAHDAHSLLARLRVDSPPANIVLLDWELPGLEPQSHLSVIRQHDPACTLVAMSGRPEARAESLRLGAQSFISKNESPDTLLRLLRNEGGH
ncbi:MAG: response regulator [Actinobacteria bacterium]|nr:response regulator [Actinomycetota bacterium]